MPVIGPLSLSSKPTVLCLLCEAGARTLPTILLLLWFAAVRLRLDWTLWLEEGRDFLPVVSFILEQDFYPGVSVVTQFSQYRNAEPPAQLAQACPFKGPCPWPYFKSRDTSPAYRLLSVRGFAPWGFSKLLGFTSSNLCPLHSPPSRSQPCLAVAAFMITSSYSPFSFVVTILYMIFSLCSNN